MKKKKKMRKPRLKISTASKKLPAHDGFSYECVCLQVRYQPPTPQSCRCYRRPHQRLWKWVTWYLLFPALCRAAADTHLSTTHLSLELPSHAASPATGGRCAWMQTYQRPQILDTEGWAITLNIEVWSVGCLKGVKVERGVWCVLVYRGRKSREGIVWVL